MRTRIFTLCLFAALAASVQAAPPDDGQIDNAWGPTSNGRSLVSFDVDLSDPDDVSQAAVADAQGRTYLVGTVHTPDGERIGITRLLRNGHIDTGYGDNGKVVSTYPSTGVAAVLDAEGDLLVGGNRTNDGGDTDFALCRFDTNGQAAAFTANPSNDACVTVPFNLGGNWKDTLHAIALQDDGRIILAGEAEASATIVKGAVARLKTDGTLDTNTFGVDGKELVQYQSHDVYNFRSVAVSPNGKIVLVGEVRVNKSSPRDALMMRLLATGFPDESLSCFAVECTYFTHADTDDYFTRVLLITPPPYAENPDNESAVGASETAPASQRFDGWITRIDFTGSVTTSFGINGNVLFNPGGTLEFRSIFQQPDGKLVAAGTGSNEQGAYGDFYAMRVTRDGVLDPEFHAPNGIIAIDIQQDDHQDVAYAMAAHPDRFVIAGSTSSEIIPKTLDFASVALTRDRIFADGVDLQN